MPDDGGRRREWFDPNTKYSGLDDHPAVEFSSLDFVLEQLLTPLSGAMPS